MIRKLVLLTALASASAFTTVSPPVTSTKLFADVSVEEATTTGTSMGAEAISGLTKDVKTVFSLEDIAKILPHRYPFLLVDKVVEYEEGKVRLIVMTILFAWNSRNYMFTNTDTVFDREL